MSTPPLYDTIFLDRDGTLNPDPGYIDSLEHYQFYDFTLKALQLLARHGYRFCIVTNQSGVGRGLIKPEKLAEIHHFIEKTFNDHGIPLLGIYQCTDHPQEASEHRKPGSGMFLEAAADHGIILPASLMIGDAVSDMEAGVKLGMDTMLVLTGKGKETDTLLKDQFYPTYVVENLLTGARQLTGGDVS